MNKPFIIDAHLDLSMNALELRGTERSVYDGVR